MEENPGDMHFHQAFRDPSETLIGHLSPGLLDILPAMDLSESGTSSALIEFDIDSLIASVSVRADGLNRSLWFWEPEHHSGAPQIQKS